MALYDADGTATGSAVVTGSLGVLSSVGGSLAGGSSLSVAPETTFDVSGYVVGAGDLFDARLMDASGVALGGSIVVGNGLRLLGASGYALGGSSLSLSVPEPIFGVAVVTAYAEVIHVPLPICATPIPTTSFRWGHTFTRGDLAICIVNAAGNPLGPVCISYTLGQVQRGCTIRPVGQTNRRPVNSSVGCFYVTGTAGECGQPGLWAIIWKYQLTFAAPVVERTCYFTVLDSVLSPVPGDTLLRACKYGWD